MIQIIVAVDDNWGISRQGAIPWHSSEDMKFFQELTVGEGCNAVVMGRKTWESLGRKFLKGRTNFVLTRNYGLLDDHHIILHIEDIPKLTTWDHEYRDKEFDDIFIIGGLEIYRQCLEAKIVDQVHISHIPGNFECDQFLPEELLEGVLRYDYYFPVN